MSNEHRPPARAHRRSVVRRSDPSVVSRGTPRNDALRDVERELEAWRDNAIPDALMPLEADDIARLVSECLTTLQLDEAIASSFTVNTVHFYRRKEILDAPEGRTSAARYTVRHVWQAVGARLAGQLGLLTLAEAREEMSGRSERALLSFVAERVLDARARQAARRSAAPTVMARPLVPATAPSAPRSASRHPQIDAIVVTLPGDAWCVVPATHPAHHSAAAARALGRALTEALHASTDTLDS